MSSRDKIIDSIRENKLVKDIKLPNYDNFGIRFNSRFETFCKMLESVGGKALVVSKEDLDKTIKEIYSEDRVIASNVDFCSLGNFDLESSSDDQRYLQDIEVAVVKGEFAVAENGAVWIDSENNQHRALYFIAQNIVIVVEKDNIVNNMHEAYGRLSFEKAGFGLFISGPSKTADIEQSLVIGAHGPKSAYVIFIDS